MQYLMKVNEATGQATTLEFTEHKFQTRSDYDKDLRENPEKYAPGIYAMYEEKPWFEIVEAPRQLTLLPVNSTGKNVVNQEAKDGGDSDRG